MDPAELARALDHDVAGFGLDVVAQHLGLARRRRWWWFDEFDRSLRRRCQAAFLSRFRVCSLKFRTGR